MDGLSLKTLSVGCVLTMTAISLGVPFWFDALNKIIVLRATVKSDEKSPPEPSTDAQS